MAKLSRVAKERHKTKRNKPEDFFDYPEESHADIPDQSEPEEKLPKSCHYTFQNFLTRNNLLSEQTTVYVYKYTTDHGIGMELCTQSVGEMPEEHSLGLQFGGGRYKAVIQAVDNNGKRSSTSKTFRLHKRYDSLMQSTTNSNLPPALLAGTGSASGGTSNVREMLLLMQSFMQILSPLLNKKEQSQPEYMAEMFANNFKLMNQSMRDVYADTSQFLNEKLRSQQNLPETMESESEVTGVMGVVNSIIPLLEKFLPTILAPGAGSKLTVETIKALPEFKKLSKDRNMIKQIIGHIYNKHGENAAKEACKKFKIRYVNPQKKQPEKAVK